MADEQNVIAWVLGAMGTVGGLIGGIVVRGRQVARAIAPGRSRRKSQPHRARARRDEGRTAPHQRTHRHDARHTRQGQGGTVTGVDVRVIMRHTKDGVLNEIARNPMKSINLPVDLAGLPIGSRLNRELSKSCRLKPKEACVQPYTKLIVILSSEQVFIEQERYDLMKKFGSVQRTIDNDLFDYGPMSISYECTFKDIVFANWRFQALSP